MNRNELECIVGRLVLPPAGAGGPDVEALARENLALEQLARAAGPPPSLEDQLQAVFAAKPSQEETMFSHLFFGRSPIARLAIAVCLLAGIAALALLLPRIRVTSQGPSAALPIAWAEHDSHVLLFDFGAVIEIPEGASFSGEGNFLTLSMAKAIVERLRAEVWSYADSTAGPARKTGVRRLGVFAYRVSLTESRRDRAAIAKGHYSAASTDFKQRYVAGVVLEDPTEASALLTYLAHIPQLPAGELVNATVLTAKGVPDLGQTGVTVGLQFDPMVIQNLPQDATPEQRQAEYERWQAYYKPHYEFFSFPANASEEQIEAQLSQWLAENRTHFDYTVDVELAGTGINREVTVNVKGLREESAADYEDPKSLYGPIYVLGNDGELIEVDPRNVPIELP